MSAHDHDHGDHDHDHGHSHEGLDVQVKNTAPCKASIAFTVSPDEFEKARRQRLQHMARHTRMKGFRPGKTPIQVVEKHFGEQVDHETVQHFLNHAYDQAVREHSLRPAAHPRVDVDAIEVERGKELRHEFEVSLRPEIELGNYKGLKIEGRPTDVTDEEVHETLEDLRRRHARPVPVGDEGLPADGMAVAKLEFLVEGSEEPVLDRDGMRLSPKAPPPGVEAAAFEEGLTGAKEGETREFPCEFDEHFPEESARGKKGTCRVTLSEAVRFEPPTDEELCEGFLVEDVAGLEKKVHDRLVEAKQNQERSRIENEILDRLIQDHPMELPEDLVLAQTERKVEELRKSLDGQELDEAALEERLEVERRSAAEGTTRALKAVYLMEEIARAEELQVTADDIRGELAEIAKRNNASVEDVRKYYQEEGLVQQLGLELLERKVRNFLRESADIQAMA